MYTPYLHIHETKTKNKSLKKKWARNLERRVFKDDLWMSNKPKITGNVSGSMHQRRDHGVIEALGKLVCRFINRLSTDFPCNPAIPLLIPVNTARCVLVCETAQQQSSQWPKAYKSSVSNRWTDDQKVVPVDQNYHSLMKRNKALLSMFHEESKICKNKYCMIPHRRKIWNRQIHRHIK